MKIPSRDRRPARPKETPEGDPQVRATPPSPPPAALMGAQFGTRAATTGSKSPGLMTRLAGARGPVAAALLAAMLLPAPAALAQGRHEAPIPPAVMATIVGVLLIVLCLSLGAVLA